MTLAFRGQPDKMNLPQTFRTNVEVISRLKDMSARNAG